MFQFQKHFCNMCNNFFRLIFGIRKLQEMVVLSPKVCEKKIGYITSWGAGLQITDRHQANWQTKVFSMFDKMPTVIGHYVAWDKCFCLVGHNPFQKKKKHICSLDGVNIK